MTSYFDRLTVRRGGRRCRVHMQVCEPALTRYNKHTHGRACEWRLEGASTVDTLFN